MRYSEEEFARIEKRAEEGDAEALYILGDIYVNDADGDERTQMKGFFCFEKAALSGYALAQLSLAVCYEMGLCPEGVCDEEKALHWYEKAAEQGVISAQYELARDYEEGRYFKQDYEKAFYWYSRAAETGSYDAKFKLAYFYENGLGVKKDIQKAICYYKIASECCLIGTRETAKKKLKELGGI